MLKPTTLAMILAGGRVDELNVLTQYRPKSAVPFGGVGRVIDFALSNLMNSGIEQVALLSQYRSYSLIKHLGTGKAWDMTGRYRHVSVLPPFHGSDGKSWYRGPADAVRQNLDYVRYHDPEEILILSGDHIYRMDYQDMIEFHHKNNADLTLAFTRMPVADAHRYGIAEMEGEDEEGGRILRYWEKPAYPKTNWASMTILCFRPEVLYQALTENTSPKAYHFGKDIIPWLLDRGYRLFGYKFCGYWGYTRTLEEYWQSSMDMLGAVPKIDLEKWVFRTNLDHRGIRDHQPALIGEDARIDNSLVYNGCKIDGTVRNSILFPGVHVASGAVVTDSVIFFKNSIGKNCRLSKIVSDVNNTYLPGVDAGTTSPTTGPVTAIGYNNTLPAGVMIGEGAKIYPHLPEASWPKEIAAGEVVR